MLSLNKKKREKKTTHSVRHLVESRNRSSRTLHSVRLEPFRVASTVKYAPPPTQPHFPRHPERVAIGISAIGNRKSIGSVASTGNNENIVKLSEISRHYGRVEASAAVRRESRQVNRRGTPRKGGLARRKRENGGR